MSCWCEVGIFSLEELETLLHFKVAVHKWAPHLVIMWDHGFIIHVLSITTIKIPSQFDLAYYLDPDALKLTHAKAFEITLFSTTFSSKYHFWISNLLTIQDK